MSTKQTTGLMHFDRARVALEKATSVDEVKGIRDKAEAARAYAKQANMGLEMQNRCADVKLHAERRAGELLGKMELKSLSQKSKSHGGTCLSDLDINRNQSSRWQKLFTIPKRKFEGYIKKTIEAKDELTTAGALRLVIDQNKQEVVETLKKQPKPKPSGTFDVLVIDPPWRYDATATSELREPSKKHRGEIPYPDMSLDEIKALPVAKRANKNCILWLWTTNAFMREAFECLDVWGFEQKTILTWVKDRMGVGHWLRGQTEHCLLAVRGKPVVTLTNQTTVLNAKLREHSRKPDEFFAMVAKLCPGTKLELFAREKRKGWQVWGAETEKFE